MKINLKYFNEEIEKNAVMGALLEGGFAVQGLMHAGNQAKSVYRIPNSRPRPLQHFTQYGMQRGRFPLMRFS